MLKDAFSFVLQGINCEKKKKIMAFYYGVLYIPRVAFLVMQS